MEFNNNGLDGSIKEAFQMSLLRLVLVTIMLEDQITLSVGNLPTELPAGASTEWDRVRTSVQYSLTKVRSVVGHCPVLSDQSQVGCGS